MHYQHLPHQHIGEFPPVVPNPGHLREYSHPASQQLLNAFSGSAPQNPHILVPDKEIGADPLPLVAFYEFVRGGEPASVVVEGHGRGRGVGV